MSAWELKRDHLTRYCLFGIDSSEDLVMLPTSVTVGSGDLVRSTTCAIGSIARASDGSQYILTGDNEWIGYDAGGGGLVMYECQEGEYDPQTGEPTIEDPNESTIYLVPTGDSAAPYRGWIYINEEWAQFAGGGGGSIDVPVTDVQVNGVSVLDAQGVAEIPAASDSVLGMVKVDANGGIGINNNSKKIYTVCSTSEQIKNATNRYTSIVPSIQHESTFYGLSKVAGVDLANETVTVGTYPDTAKSAIRTMIGAGDSNGTEIVRLI